MLKVVAVCLLGTATAQGAEPKVKTEAGPFSIRIQKQWNEEVKVEKKPFTPLYKEEAKPVKPMNVKRPGDEIRPEHWAIELPKLGGRILIHKAADWAVVYDDGNGGHPTVKQELAIRRQRMEKPVPNRDDFIAARKEIKFAGGHGFRVLIQDDFEVDLLRQGVQYYFVGMSDDDSCHIEATFTVTIPGLPDGDNKAEHLGFSTSRYRELVDGFRTYHRKAVKWLDENAGKATPSLKELDAMMSSLVAKKWE